MNNIITKEHAIQNKIFIVRDMQVMLDADLAELYGVQTKRINEAVRNNPDKFPSDFYFELSEEEDKILRSKISTFKESLKNSIVLFDNYIDESVLIFLSKRVFTCQVTIYTKTISKQLTLDLQKHNAQYPHAEIKKFDLSHDRFLLIDDEVYHIGASLKDLGKKWFAFSKMDKSSFEIMQQRMSEQLKLYNAPKI